ncbi:MAG: DHA2 family efflux MFS transporter permease subunit [Desulfobacterales bacterium]|nr:DHA2 family efflux MFS transporter permease subunit [Desulfobacterales bacterium]
MTISPAQRSAVIIAALLALFLGAMDALVVSAAMPTIVAELGGLHLYSWVYSSYFLARAVSLPIFGKLADLYKNRNLFLAAIGLFIMSSVAAGFAFNMISLIIARAFQGIGAGAIFALVYVVLADVSPPQSRGRTLSFASSVWGIASVLGPTLGGFIVSYFSWRWIFFINIPLGLISFWGIGAYLLDVRAKKDKVSMDFAGVASLSTAVLALLFAFLLGGRNYAWSSSLIIGLLILSLACIIAFIAIEHRAKDPILSIAFFRIRGFSTANAAVFLSSFVIFSMFAFAPLFIQGAQGRSPMVVGVSMLSLSLGWSLGALVLGQFIDRVGRKGTAVAGAVCLMVSCAVTLTFKPATSTYYVFFNFFVMGIGMGWVALSTLLVVQSCLDEKDLGVATSSNQFARTLGGAVGVGICGSFIAARFSNLFESVRNSDLMRHLPGQMGEAGFGQVESLLHPEAQATMPDALRHMVQDAVMGGVGGVFWTVTVAAGFCILLCLLIPGEKKKIN